MLLFFEAILTSRQTCEKQAFSQTLKTGRPEGMFFQNA